MLTRPVHLSPPQSRLIPAFPLNTNLRHPIESRWIPLNPGCFAIQVSDNSQLRAINIKLGEDGKPPELVELLPAGTQVLGRDSREW